MAAGYATQDEVDRLAKPLGYQIDLPLDAGYVQGEVLDWPVTQNVRLVGRIGTNAMLQERAAPQLARPGASSFERQRCNRHIKWSTFKPSASISGQEHWPF